MAQLRGALDSRKAWTAQSVAAQLVRAFRLLPGHPVYGDSSRLTIAGMDGEIGGFAATVLSWSRYVPPNPPSCVGPGDRLCLMTWARARAIPTHSVAEFCREYRLERRTFDRRRLRAAAAI